ncbi:MAG: EFR1 family ferrodoxin [Anaerovoracaceae bacterium]
MIIYFTGTGNSKFCAEYIGGQLGDQVIDSFEFISGAKAGEFESDEPWVFVCPTYGWRIPRVFEEFIKRARFEGSRKAYFIMNCGSDIGGPEKYLEALCQGQDLDFMGVLEVLMPENYLAMFNVPSEDEIVRIVNNAIPVLKAGADTIAAGHKFQTGKGSVLNRLKSDLINPLFYWYSVKDKAFAAKDSCISCGKCVEVCPLANVSLAHGKPVWAGNCTHCMACITSCPTEAIEYGKKSQGKLRYRCKKFEDK